MNSNSRWIQLNFSQKAREIFFSNGSQISNYYFLLQTQLINPTSHIPFSFAIKITVNEISAPTSFHILRIHQNILTCESSEEETILKEQPEIIIGFYYSDFFKTNAPLYIVDSSTNQILSEPFGIITDLPSSNFFFVY